jgi:hypothetical protein
LTTFRDRARASEQELRRRNLREEEKKWEGLALRQERAEYPSRHESVDRKENEERPPAQRGGLLRYSRGKHPSAQHGQPRAERVPQDASRHHPHRLLVRRLLGRWDVERLGWRADGGHAACSLTCARSARSEQSPGSPKW